jgi:D-alanyl-D-alanine carboxypeptidase/D-alanyl-D-alanine carboxypeptidase (penicillin-binding protein 5/6)
VNHNRLLREHGDVIGVKTGYTKKCGRTLVSAARRDGLTLVAVTLCDGDDWRDHRAMLDYGFELYGEETVCRERELSFSVPVAGGEKAEVTLENREALTAVLSKCHGEISTKTEIPRFIYAGAKKGDAVGRVRFFEGGREIGSLTLYLSEDAPKKAGKKRII